MDKARQGAGTIVRCAIPARVPRSKTQTRAFRGSQAAFAGSSPSLSSAAPTNSSPSTSATPPPFRHEQGSSSLQNGAPRAGSTLFDPPVEKMEQKIGRLLEPLGVELGQAIVQRVLTHKSAASGKKGVPHAEKYAFIGRRVLRMHLTIYLMSKLAQTDPTATKQFVTNDSLSAILDTNELGMHAGKAIGLEQVIRWRQVRDKSGQPTGLFKARGTALEALVGAVHLTSGIEASSKVFKELVLPNMVLPKSLQAALDPTQQRSDSPASLTNEQHHEPERARATA